MPEAVFGTFTYEKATPNKFRYQMVSDGGSKDTIYIPKDKASSFGLKGVEGESFEMVIRSAGE